ncbi:MAG: Na-translocating system protein MpsC family protein [Cyanobacteria bacterium J06621_8]
MHRSKNLRNLESTLSLKIRNVYQKQLEHQIQHISYKLFDRTLMITLEGIITSPEKLLKENERFDLMQQMRTVLDDVVHLQIQTVIEETLNVKIVDYLSDTKIDNDISGAIAILEFKPK